MKGLKDLRIDLKKVTELCEKHEVKLLVLHGSYARGRATAKSDIDIGILSKHKIDSDKYQSILRDFVDIFSDGFDPVFLNGVEPLISYQAAIHGVPLYEAGQGAFAEYKLQAISRYFDTSKFRDLEKEYVKRAIK